MKRIVVFNAPVIARMLGVVLEGEYVVRVGDYPGPLQLKPSIILHYVRQIWSSDIVYCMFISPYLRKLARIAKLLGKKVVFHWLGTDVYNALQCVFDARSISEYADLQLCYSMNLKQELNDLGIESEVFTIVPDGLSLSPAKVPSRHAVLVSIPDDRKEFYGYGTLIKVIEKMPDLAFYIVRSEHPEYYPYPNVVFKGILDREQMDALYDEITIALRYPEHDGLSLVMMEATIKGKAMVYRFEHPFAIKVTGVEEICRALEHIVEQPPKLNKAACDYGIQHYSKESCRAIGLGLLRKLFIENH